MPIFDQGYQHWQGKLSGHAWRWLTITRHGVRAQMKSRWTRLVLFFALTPALVLAGFLILWGLVEQKSSLVTPLLPLLQGILPPEALEGPKAFRVTIWTIAYQFFFDFQIFFVMILVLLIGPGLISQDLRFNAIPLYFSRPLRRFDYFAGKLGTIGVFLGVVAIIPALLAYVLGVCFSLDLSVTWETARVVAAAVAYGLVIVVSTGTLMLAISSLSRNSRYVAVAWFGFWLVTNATSGILFGAVRSDWCHLVSYTTNLKRVGGSLLDTRAAWGQIAHVLEAARPAAPGMFPPPGRPPRPAGGKGKIAPRPNTDSVGNPQPNHRPPGLRIEEFGGPSYPWYWSAGVLVGLFGLSLCILSSRVKTLDRLK